MILHFSWIIYDGCFTAFYANLAYFTGEMHLFRFSAVLRKKEETAPA